ncbi:hypothetical protein QYF36_026151 [Acer negundo]|nr:hypothetical protein QYF36_026151 [Acer negundo]
MGILLEEIKPFSLDLYGYNLQIGFFANGALYWHVQYIANMEYYERGGVSYDTADDGVLNTILCFDLVDRKFSMIVPPVDDEVCKKPVFDLCVFGGHLCMVYYDHNCHTDIWAWEGNNKGNWIKLMSIPYLSPVFLMNNGQLLLKTIMKEEYMTPFADIPFIVRI